MNSFTNIEDYEAFLKSINPETSDLGDIKFYRRSNAVVTKIGQDEDEYSGDIYEEPITAPSFDDISEIVNNIDFDMPYRIITDAFGIIRDFEFYEKDNDTPVILHGKEAENVFFVFMGAIKNIKKEHANITTIDDSSLRR